MFSTIIVFERNPDCSYRTMASEPVSLESHDRDSGALFLPVAGLDNATAAQLAHAIARGMENDIATGVDRGELFNMAVEMEQEQRTTKEQRVVILIDGDSQEILENEEMIDVEYIRWSQIVDDPDMPADAADDLEKALVDGDLDKAIRISEMLTAEPPDGQDPRELGQYP